MTEGAAQPPRCEAPKAVGTGIHRTRQHLVLGRKAGPTRQGGDIAHSPLVQPCLWPEESQFAPG